MKNKHVTTALLIISLVMGAILLGGCGGDAGSCGFGGARGYVYQPTGGGGIIISASPTPPEGYKPVEPGTVVRIDGYPELDTYTHTDGYYYIPTIPTGLQTLVVEGASGDATLSIPIIANRITDGGGHTEGGGGDDGGETGDMTTYTQGGWGAAPRGNNAGMLLSNNFTRVFPNGVRLGVPNGVTFTTAKQIEDFLPQGGTAGSWTSNQTLPITSSTAGVFAGQVLAMQLNVSFSTAGVLPSGLANMHVASGPYQGYLVSDLLLLAQRVLGGDPTVTPPTTVAVLNEAITAFNENFDNGTTNRGFLR